MKKMRIVCLIVIGVLVLTNIYFVYQYIHLMEYQHEIEGKKEYIFYELTAIGENWKTQGGIFYKSATRSLFDIGDIEYLGRSEDLLYMSAYTFFNGHKLDDATYAMERSYEEVDEQLISEIEDRVDEKRRELYHMQADFDPNLVTWIFYVTSDGELREETLYLGGKSKIIT